MSDSLYNEMPASHSPRRGTMAGVFAIGCVVGLSVASVAGLAAFQGRLASIEAATDAKHELVAIEGCATVQGQLDTMKSQYARLSTEYDASGNVLVPCVNTTNLAIGNWVLVRHVPSGSEWATATDELAGTDVYGDSTGGPLASAGWSTKFSTLSFDRFLFASGDCKKWLITAKDQVLGSYENAERQIMQSSTSPTSYTARWYRRSVYREDPWVSLEDHATAIGDGNIMYGENSWSSGKYINVPKYHKGANVYIHLTAPAPSGALFRTPCSSWSAARTYCQSKGGDLVMIKDKVKDAKVKKFYDSLSSWDSGCYYGPYPWTGGTCGSTLDSCKWIDGSALSYKHAGFTRDDPNMHIYPDGSWGTWCNGTTGSQGTWSHGGCKSRGICEMYTSI